MHGWIGITDPGWYERLANGPAPRDANFWRPSTKVYRLPIGTPFFFKLRAPHWKIAGFGYFAGFSVLPDWLAWETFQEANGVASLAELRARLGRIQQGGRIQPDGGGRIGCALIAEARFFPPHAWVAPPRDWSPRTVTGARCSLTEGEGRRIWAECLARVEEPAAPEIPVYREPTERFGKPVLRAPRLGQGIFRVHVLDAYGRACAATGEHSLPVLEAAHIKPYALGGEHAVSNGLALRSDLHRLFDRGYVTVDEAERLVVGGRLKEHFDNGRSYYGLHGTRLTLPADAALRPSAAALAWHREQVFLG